jgi:hypothetical protein
MPNFFKKIKNALTSAGDVGNPGGTTNPTTGTVASPDSVSYLLQLSHKFNSDISQSSAAKPAEPPAKAAVPEDLAKKIDGDSE